MIQCFCNFNEYLAGPLILRVSETLTLNRLLVNSDRPPEVHLALMITENTFVIYLRTSASFSLFNKLK